MVKGPLIAFTLTFEVCKTYTDCTIHIMSCTIFESWINRIGPTCKCVVTCVYFTSQKLEAFVEATGKKFVEHEQRICELESNLSALQTKTSVVEKALQMREEEIATLRGECKSISVKMIDVEEQNQGLREENALAFTKVYKKLESSSTPEGL